MRTPPGPIPAVLPNINQVVDQIHKTINRPIVRLADSSIYSLVRRFDGDVWLTGSTVWLQAVYGAQPDLNGDFDIIFSDKYFCDKFADYTLNELNNKIGKPLEGYTVVINKMGGVRITHPDGRGIIDIWHLENESIAECVSAFPGGDHVKCAYEISQYPRTANLTRVVRIPSLKKNRSYPGSDPWSDDGLLKHKTLKDLKY